MSKFDQFDKQQEIQSPYREVSFYFDCTICDEELETGRYYPNEDALIFICSQGHKSLMEGIGIAF